MALYEFRCEDCNTRFEQIVSSGDWRKQVKCAKCQGSHIEKLISAFKVGGQGDLRESTMHGCHEACPSLPFQKKGHCHGHCED